MKYMTLRTVYIVATISLIINLFSVQARAENRIGVLLFSDEPRYTNAAKGIMDQLTKDGFAEPNVKILTENAMGNKARAVELVQTFAAAKFDLIFTLGTSATVSLTKEIKDVPVVFGMVYDPVGSGVAKDWKSSGNNTTGVSPNVPMSNIMDRLKELVAINRVAVLYTPGEKNSEIQLKDLQEIQTDYNFKVIPVPITKLEEVSLLMPDVVRKAEAIYITGSTMLSTAHPVICDIANKAKVVTVSHLEDIVERGALMGVCPNTYLIGRRAGEMGVKILKGAKPASIPIETMKEFDLIVNMKSAKAGQFQIPPEFMKKVTRQIQ